MNESAGAISFGEPGPDGDTILGSGACTGNEGNGLYVE